MGAVRGPHTHNSFIDCSMDAGILSKGQIMQKHKDREAVPGPPSTVRAGRRAPHLTSPMADPEAPFVPEHHRHPTSVTVERRAAGAYTNGPRGDGNALPVCVQGGGGCPPFLGPRNGERDRYCTRVGSISCE